MHLPWMRGRLRLELRCRQIVDFNWHWLSCNNSLTFLVLTHKLLKFYLLFEGAIKQLSNHGFSESTIRQRHFLRYTNTQNYKTDKWPINVASKHTYTDHICGRKDENRRKMAEFSFFMKAC